MTSLAHWLTVGSQIGSITLGTEEENLMERPPLSAPRTTESNGTTSRASGERGGRSVQLKQSLRRMDLQSQLAALAPSPEPRPSTGPPTVGADGTPVQMKIDLATLNAKVESTPEYSGTIDGDTDCATANEVGESWVGTGASRRTYGPPFAYQLLSADGKRQYRPPMVKQSGKMVGNAQANYEARSGAGARSRSTHTSP